MPLQMKYENNRGKMSTWYYISSHSKPDSFYSFSDIFSARLNSESFESMFIANAAGELSYLYFLYTYNSWCFRLAFW